MFQTVVQRSVARYLASHPFFSVDPAIPVIAQNDKDLLTKMTGAIGRLGLVVLVAPLGGKYGLVETNANYFKPAKFTCRVRENIMVNRASTGTGQSADYVAEVCAKLLKLYVPLSEDGTPLTGSSIKVTDINLGEDEKGIYAWDCLFELEGALCHEPVRRAFDETEF